MTRARLRSGVFLVALVMAGCGQEENPAAGGPIEPGAQPPVGAAPPVRGQGALPLAGEHAGAAARTPKQDRERQQRGARAFDLWARHPDVYEHQGFAAWTKQYELQTWYETRVDDQGRSVVTIESRDPDQILAVELERPPLAPGLRPRSLRGEVIHVKPIDLSLTPLSRDRVDSLLGRTLGAEKKPVLRRPRVRFRDGIPSVTVQVQVRSPVGGMQLFEVDGLGGVEEVERVEVPVSGEVEFEELPLPEGAGDDADLDEDLASNELHHPADLRTAAEALVSGRPREEWAEAIFDHVKNFTFDGTDPLIVNFTVADTVSISREEQYREDTRRGAGVCDEFAVVAISYLRALGIPARLTYVQTLANGYWYPHAVVEYSENGVMKHMDPEGNLFNDRSHYMQYPGATEVRVSDATHPDDSLSMGPIYGYEDPDGDAMLAPWGDFSIAPSYPGAPRPGYSSPEVALDHP